MPRTLRSPEKQIQHRKKRRVLSVVAFLCAGAFVWLAVYIPSLPSLQIKNILVRGNKVLTEEEIKGKAENELSGKYLHVFPETNIFLYPKERVEKSLSEFFPRIANISANLNTDRVLVVTVVEREPSALWCGVEISEVETDNTCFYLDDNGFVFARAPHFSGNTYFEFYGKGLLPEGNPVGHDFLGSDLYRNILKIKEHLESFQMKPVKIFLTEDGGAFVTDAGGYGIRFNTDQDVSSLDSNMQSVFHSSAWGEAARSGALEYLDFRFGNKVYYKYKNKEAGILNQE